EALLAAQPQIIIDLGDYKGGMEEDLNALQEQIGVPVIFLQADLKHMAAAYRTLGELLGCSDRAEELASFIEKTLEMAEENSAKIAPEEALSVMYTSGAAGLDTNADGSSQAQVLGLVGATNAIVVDEVSNKSGGNTIDIEQLYNADPDVIIFSPGSIYETVADDSAWQELDAVKNGNCFEIPDQPYNWMSNPPSLNMVMGIWWLGNLLYPDVYDYDMCEMTQEIYKTLWGYDMSADEAQQMLADSTLKAVSVQ
ncbi:MAG: ABC transporter substrate-binding protein, partial [Oscillospiraceae bacterium]|nr:ABC transporter substrate-binding protein [Oscillospiraceae bacterium]